MVIAFVFLIFLFLLKDSLSLFGVYSLGQFLFGTNWLPVSEPPKFGMVPLLLGSIYVTVGAIVICVPIGVASAMFIAEVAPTSIKHILKALVEILAAIPSVVLGFIGIVWLGPFLRTALNLKTGMCGLTSSVLLAFMAMPTIISLSEDALVSVPKLSRKPLLVSEQPVGRHFGGLSFLPLLQVLSQELCSVSAESSAKQWLY